MLWLGSPAVQMLPHCSISCSLQSWMKQSFGECLTKQNHFFHHHPALSRTPASPCYRTPKVPLLRDPLKENNPANVTFQYICSVEMSHPVICTVQSKDWPVHFSNYIQQCPHTNKQTKSNRTVTVFCDIWTVRGGCYCFVFSFELFTPFPAAERKPVSKWATSWFQQKDSLQLHTTSRL